MATSCWNNGFHTITGVKQCWNCNLGWTWGVMNNGIGSRGEPWPLMSWRDTEEEKEEKAFFFIAYKLYKIKYRPCTKFPCTIQTIKTD